ncbi:MAG: hypothetical protein ACE147_18265 [Candidatus Methylomirabilales bacterium]
MNAEQGLPFVAINACLRDDFIQRVISRALEALPGSSEPCAAGLARALASLQIPGFRQFARAPRGLQARAAVSRFRASSEFVGCVLGLWLAGRGALAAEVERFLEGQQVPRERIRVEDGRFRGSWSLDEVLRLADLFRKEHAEADRDDVALLLCCLTSRAPVGEKAAAESPAAAADTSTPS